MHARSLQLVSLRVMVGYNFNYTQIYYEYTVCVYTNVNRCLFLRIHTREHDIFGRNISLYVAYTQSSQRKYFRHVYRYRCSLPFTYMYTHTHVIISKFTFTYYMAQNKYLRVHLECLPTYFNLAVLFVQFDIWYRSMNIYGKKASLKSRMNLVKINSDASIIDISNICVDLAN